MKRELIIVLCLLFGPVLGMAAEKGETKESVTTLATLTGLGKIELNQAKARYTLALPLSQRIAPANRVLHLDFVSSVSLLKSRSQLAVLMNGIAISQILLDPKNPHVLTDIPIPGEYLVNGYNNVEFRVVQHYTDGCEDPTSPELWTQINGEKSYFKFDYSYQPQHYTLATLDHLFDKRLPGYEVTIMSASSEFNDERLQWGSLIAQGVALRLEYIVPTFKLATVSAPLDQNTVKGDVVLVGTRAELTPYLSSTQASKVTGPYIGVMPAHDPNYQVVIISGATAEEVTQAAESFAFARQSFPDDASMVVKSLDIPAIGDKKLPQLLQPATVYRFDDLGFKTQTLTSSSVTFQVMTPPDLLRDEHAKVSFKLNLSYGAALREDSVLNIYLNGLFEKAIRLEDSDGARYNDYEITIPLTSFMPGVNILTFEPVMPPLVSGSSGECSLVQYQNAQLTLYGDSTIELPNADHYVTLPDFRIFQRTGYPFTDVAYGSNMGVVLRDQQPQTILSAWQLMAKLSQMETAPLYKAKLSFSSITGRDLFIIGARKSLQAEDLKNSPVQLGETLQFPHQVAKESERASQGFFASLFLPAQPAQLKSRQSALTFDAALGRQALMLGYPSAQERDKLVMLITSDDPEQLYTRVKELVTLKVWGNLSGNVAVWDDSQDMLLTKQAGDGFYRGKTSLRNQLGYHFSAHRNQWLITIIVVVLLLAWLGHRWLNRYKSKQHNNVKEIKS